MKAHCPIVTDVGMRQKAVKILMCYNPVWLQIGLYIVFGGESLLPDEGSRSEQDISFLKMVIEKQLFSHAGLARAYAYNKLVDGLYRPGYFENLGNIILKRFLLLVLVLDRGKSQSSLPIKYGIDGLDGGSPLLFNVKSDIKSSRQMINDFLSSDVMHGEGNLLAHLAIVGYKVFYQQTPLIEYDFKITDLFQDIQDGVRLSRAIQLLLHDSSILAKLVLPSDSHKKKTANCCTALEFLKQAGVPLHDDDGMIIVGEDVASGDKELIISLLWNMFVHLQLPLLITKNTLSEEISKISEAHPEFMVTESDTNLDMLLNWVKAICKNYDMEMDSLASLVDGKAMWCLLDFYFRKELRCQCSIKELSNASEESIVSMRDATDAVHNLVLTQKLTTLLGNFPEVLQICDILEYNGACNDKSVIILLVFLSSQLLVKKSKDKLNFHKLMGCHCQSPGRKRWSISTGADSDKDIKLSAQDAAEKFKAVQAWWQELAKHNTNCVSTAAALSTMGLSSENSSFNTCKVNAAIVIQSHFRRLIERKKYLKIRQAVTCLQLYTHAWLIAKQTLNYNKVSTTLIQEKCDSLDGLSRKIEFMLDRHTFVKMKNAAALIQKAVRDWIPQKCQKKRVLGTGGIHDDVGDGAQYDWQMCNEAMTCLVSGENNLQKEAAVKIQFAWKHFLASEFRLRQHAAATIIQSDFRGWMAQRRFLRQKQAAIKIQSIVRSIRSMKDFHELGVAIKSATVIQSHARGWIVRRMASLRRKAIVVMQSHCRCWLARKDYLRHKDDALRIQSMFKGFMCRRTFHSSRHAAREIQRFARGRISRARLLGASSFRTTASRQNVLTISNRSHSTEMRIVLYVIVKLQRWWRRVLKLKLSKEAAIVIQAFVRGWICRQKAATERHQAVMIQAHWKGYLARISTKGQLADLRSRIKRSAATVEDGMCIMNRLVAALKELKSMKNVSGILHNCATLDLATTHSQKCCERLVDEGAIDILLYQICAVTRSIPDQQVLKYCLSTLRNLARYPNLADILIQHKGSVETILRELLRNKEEGYFIAIELLKKLCSRPGGTEAICSLPSMLKRLHSLVEDLTRKVNREKRNHHKQAGRDTTERRLKEASELLNLITYG